MFLSPPKTCIAFKIIVGLKSNSGLLQIHSDFKSYTNFGWTEGRHEVIYIITLTVATACIYYLIL